MFSRFRDKVLPRRKSAAPSAFGNDDDQNLSELSSSSRLQSVSSVNGVDDDGVDGDDSSAAGEEEAADAEGPTVIAVDDGRGGIRHVRVSHPPDAQFDTASTAAVDQSANHVGKRVQLVETPASSPDHVTASPPSVADLLRREFRGKPHLLHLESDAEKLRKRIVSKKGVVHIGRSHLEREQKRKMLTDFFNTMLDMQWRYVLLVFSLSFMLSWLGFAVVWYAILWLRGDFEADHLPDKQENGAKWTPCVWAMHDFASCFLFSVETQHTIGYGSRQTTEKCPEAIIVMSVQSVVGVMIQACMVGTIFAKLSRPKRRAEAILFSRNAAVCLREGMLCLCARMANLRAHSHLVECHARAVLVSRKVTDEGEVVPYHQTELSVGTDLEGEQDSVLFIWPTTLVHRIDEDSPLYAMSARDFVKKRFEIIFTLEGIVEPTGMSFQARTSYLPNEILWGHRFVNILNYKRKEGVYKVDYGSFNTLLKVDTPTCSAKALKERSNNHGQHGTMTPTLAKRSLPSSPTPSPAVLTRLRAAPDFEVRPMTPQIRIVSEGSGNKNDNDKKEDKDCEALRNNP